MINIIGRNLCIGPIGQVQLQFIPIQLDCNQPYIMGINNFVISFFGINFPLGINSSDAMHRIAKKYKDKTPEWKLFWQDHSNELTKQTPVEDDEDDNLTDEFFHAMNLGNKFTLVEISDENGTMYYIALERFFMKNWGYGSGTCFEMDFEKKKIIFTGRDRLGEYTPRSSDFPTNEEIEILKKWRDEIDENSTVGFVNISEYN